MPISFAAAIKPLFTTRDIRCMTGRRWPLDNYDFMAAPEGDFIHADHAHARTVYQRLLPEAGNLRMPRGGPYWSDEQMALYRQWMEEGFNP